MEKKEKDSTKKRAKPAKTASKKKRKSSITSKLESTQQNEKALSYGENQTSEEGSTVGSSGHISNLMIVESPAKAKTIAKFLGKDFHVVASFGHIIDLPEKELGVDVANNFSPKYEVIPGKEKIVSELKKLAGIARSIWIATDEDREGEAIGWHICNAIGVDIQKIPRIVFHEITKDAILTAIQNPRTIDMNLVNAQQARRILDRLVGFELSPILWKKIKAGLSAGRVQSVAVKLITEREREILSFKPQESFKIEGVFQTSKKEKFLAKAKEEYKNEHDVFDFLGKCQKCDFFVANVTTKPSKKNPPAPFTTSSLQQEASRKLGMSVAKTMQIAQKLYEAGYITYMRTDAVTMSTHAVQMAVQTIERKYGKEYVQTRVYENKIKGAQEAHECIRPTDFSREVVSQDASEQKLYRLIWQRSLASQMASAEISKTIIEIQGKNRENEIVEQDVVFYAQGETITFDGFLKVYQAHTEEEVEQDGGNILPHVSTGDVVSPTFIRGTQFFSKHPPRYTEASLVKKLEELGIGRPSTYAPTINTIQKRGYVVREDREGHKETYVDIELDFTAKNPLVERKVKTRNVDVEKGKLFPTDMGFAVTDFLQKNFSDILDYSFTARIEEQFDDIALGTLGWQDMIRAFYEPFHANVVKVINEKEKVQYERILGKDPQTNYTVLARLGKFGPVVQLGTREETKKPQFASIIRPFTIEEITLEDALKLFSLPKNLGDYQGKPVTMNMGKFGPYIKRDTLFVSLPKNSEKDLSSFTIEDAIELIKQKQDLRLQKQIRVFLHEKGNIEVLQGRYGPYISYQNKNFKIPKGIDPFKLTYEDCVKIIEGK